MVLTMNIPSDLIQLSDAAREYSKAKIGAIGVTYWGLRGWVVRGELDSWKQGEKIFVSRAQLEQKITPKPMQKDDSTEG